MVVKDIIQLMKAVQQSDFDSFELNDKDFSLKLDRRSGKSTVSAEPKLLSETPAVGALHLLSETPEAPSNSVFSGTKEVLSPIIGVYHSLEGDNAIKPGDKIKKGQPICLIEAMKLMNEVQMPEDGEITKVYAKDGETIEYGQILFSYM